MLWTLLGSAFMILFGMFFGLGVFPQDSLLKLLL